MLYLLLYVRGLKVKALIGFMFLFLLAVVVAKGPHKCRTMFCVVVAVRYLFKSVENDQLRIFPARRRRRGEGRGGEGREWRYHLTTRRQRKVVLLFSEPHMQAKSSV